MLCCFLWGEWPRAAISNVLVNLRVTCKIFTKSYEVGNVILVWQVGEVRLGVMKRVEQSDGGSSVAVRSLFSPLKSKYMKVNSILKV